MLAWFYGIGWEGEEEDTTPTGHGHGCQHEGGQGGWHEGEQGSQHEMFTVNLQEIKEYFCWENIDIAIRGAQQNTIPNSMCIWSK